LSLVDVHVSATFRGECCEENNSLQAGENFSEVKESVTDEESSGQPATSRTE